MPEFPLASGMLWNIADVSLSIGKTDLVVQTNQTIEDPSP
jgi:hypothetical protein